MKSISLERIVKVSKGKKHDQCDSSSVNSRRYIQIGDLRHDENLKFTDATKGTEVTPEDVIIAWDGANAGTVSYGLTGFIGSTLARIRLLSQDFFTPYLGHFLKSKFKDIQRNCTGATIPHVSKPHLLSLKIPLPPLEEQKKIAVVLDKTDALRRKQHKALKLCDQFLKATFIGMFGDPVKNPRQFPLHQLKNFYVDSKNGTKCGPFGSALKKGEYVDSGVPVWNMDNINKDGSFNPNIRLWITPSKFTDLKKYSTQKNDIIISRAGTVGKMCVINSSYEDAIISTNLIRVRFGAKLLPIYFVSLMNYCKGRVGNLRTGPDGTFTHMNTGVLDNLKFPYPPLKYQNKFAEIAKKVKATKEEIQISLNKLDNTFNALSQKAFKGELGLKDFNVPDVDELPKEFLDKSLEVLNQLEQYDKAYQAVDVENKSPKHTQMKLSVFIKKHFVQYRKAKIKKAKTQVEIDTAEAIKTLPNDRMMSCLKDFYKPFDFEIAINDIRTLLEGENPFLYQTYNELSKQIEFGFSNET